MSPQLTGSHRRCPHQGSLSDLSGQFPRESRGEIGEDPGPSQIDQTLHGAPPKPREDVHRAETPGRSGFRRHDGSDATPPASQKKSIPNRSSGSGDPPAKSSNFGHRLGHRLDVGIQLGPENEPTIRASAFNRRTRSKPDNRSRSTDDRITANNRPGGNRLQISRQPTVVIPLRIEKIEIRRQNLSIEHTFEITTYPRQIPYPRRPIRGISSMPLRPPRPPATRRSPRPNNPTPPAPHRCPPPASVARDAPRKVFPTSRWASPEC